MKLKAKTENQQTTFYDADGQVIYSLVEPGAGITGTIAKEVIKAIVDEYLRIDKVMSADVQNASGWAWSIVGRLEQRQSELRIALMNVTIKEIENG